MEKLRYEVAEMKYQSTKNRIIAGFVALGVLLSSVAGYMLHSGSSSYATIVDIPLPRQFPQLKAPLGSGVKEWPLLRGVRFDADNPFTLQFFLV